MDSQVNCTVCNSNENTFLFHIEPRRIVQCANCGHEYVNNPPEQRPEYYFSENEEETLQTTIDFAFLKKIFQKYLLTGGRLLDIGCGQGRLEKGLLQQGFRPENLHLMDTSEKNIAITHGKYPACNYVTGNAEQQIPFSNYFNCILAVEFLEDLAQPKNAMTNMLDAALPGGIIILRGLPNNQSLEAFLGQEKWKMRQFIHHNQFFNPDTFTRFMSQFPAEVLEFGTFLQEGYHFFNIARVAKNLGATNGETLAKKLSAIEKYPRKDLLPPIKTSSMQETEDFFDTLSLDYRIASDFTAVIRKK